jgi:nucleoid DNA-binding protein
LEEITIVRQKSERIGRNPRTGKPRSSRFGVQAIAHPQARR